MLLALLACAEHTEKPDSALGPDTAVDSAGPDSADDTAPDTADSSPDSGGGDTGPSPTYFAAAPDFSLEPCGTDETMGDAVDAGADIDGDGLADALVGAPGNDEHGEDYGAVYVFLGSGTGALAPVDAWATLYGEGAPFAAEWYDDLDGDGIPEVAAGAWFFSGARVLAGGDITAATDALPGWSPVGVPYADVDGDGVREVLVSNGDREGRVTLLDGASALTGAGDVELGELRGGEDSWTGDLLLVVGDRDGDGLPEVVSRIGSDLVVFGSTALLAGAQVELQRAADMECNCSELDIDVFAAGDLDGDGFEDLVGGHGELTVIGSAAGDVDAAALPRITLAPGEWAEAVAIAPDLDGDGLAEVWARINETGTPAARYVAVSGAALVAGTADAASPLATIASPSPGDYTAASVGADGRFWLGDRVEYRGPGQVEVFAPAAGDDLDAADAIATLTGAPYGHPEYPFDQGLAQTVWTDLDGDGATELVVEWESEGHVFDAAALAAGGTRSTCDASASWTYTGARELDDVQLPGDLDGDGVDDVLVMSRPWGSPSSVELVSGPAFLADPAARGREVFGEDTTFRWRHTRADDIDGDGLPEWLAGTDGTTGDVLVPGTAWTTGVRTADLLGPVSDGSGELSVLGDLDGDGLLEVGTVIPGRPAYVAIFRGSDVLVPGALTSAGALVSIDADEDAVRAAAVVDDLDGDGITEVAIGTWSDTRDVTYVFAGADLAAGGSLHFADAVRSVTGRDPARWADLDGDGLAELLTWSRTDSAATLRLYLGADLAARDLTSADAVWSYTLPDPDAALLHAGPDLRGAGPALTVAWTEPDTSRARVSVFFGG